MLWNFLWRWQWHGASAGDIATLNFERGTRNSTHLLLGNSGTNSNLVQVIHSYCHDPSKFFIPPPLYAGPSAAPAAPAPLAQSHHVHPPHYAPAQPPIISASHATPAPVQPPTVSTSHTTPFYDQMTYYTIEPPDHIMEDVEPGAASPRDVDMQGPPMPKTPSPDSDGLPFHPKYVGIPGYEAMSPGELRAWLCNDPHAPPMYGSQPMSAGHTRPVSPSSSDSASLHCRISAEGRYTPITCQETPEETPAVAPADGPPPVSSGRSPRSPFGGLLPLTPLVTQVPITGQEPTIRTTHS
jgi:hypothetical protein